MIDLSGEVFFRERPLPEKLGLVVGYAHLIDYYDLMVPLPEKLSFISQRHQRYEADHWAAFTPRHQPADTLPGHLTFALRYEGVDLGILKALFDKINPEIIARWVRSEPTGRYSRRLWFFYEWLTGKILDVPDAISGNFVEALDSRLQYVTPKSISSRRHRIHNNLPGTPGFCPLVRRTEKLEAFLALKLDRLAKEQTSAVHPSLLARAAAFMVSNDSCASLALEGERPSQDRAQRWEKAISQAGKHPLTLEALLCLQSLTIEDSRFVKLGLRQEESFIGTYDRANGMPVPDHISARWEDLPSFMESFFETYQVAKGQGMDPVLLAASLAFGFVFIHPLADGNRRIHHYIIHHVLDHLGFAPEGLVFPITTVILDRLDKYREALEAYSRPRLNFITWRSTSQGNIQITNETADLYRYFDATPQAEFLYDCVRQTIETSLPAEIRHLQQYDRLKAAIAERFDMPNHLLDLLVRLLHQDQGSLPKRAREKEFKGLTDMECQELEGLYRGIG